MGRKTGAINHTHKYYRLEGLWFCGSPGCTHYMPKNMPPPVYKMSICWTCRMPMELNPDNMASSHPVHANCEPYIYEPPVLTEQQQESVEEYTERMLEASRKRQLKEKAGIEVEVAHTDGCASHSGQPCNCGAQ